MIQIQVGNHPVKEFTQNELDDFAKDLDISEVGKNIYSVIVDNKSYEISIIKIDNDEKAIQLSIDGNISTVKYFNKLDLLLKKMGLNMTATSKMTVLKSPMPGLVVDWFVKEGDSVSKGDKLLILEAMKMENIIKSSGEGVIKKVLISKGHAVEKNQVLIEFS